MRVTFWGVRGSITTPELSHARYGGNTPCVAVEYDGRHIVLDAGMGMRWMTADLLDREPDRKLHLDLLLTHCHWDHIQGIPFAPLMYLPRNSVRIYGRGGSDGLAKTLLAQMRPDFCPVPNFFLREDIGADVVLREIENDIISIGEARVLCRELPRGNRAPVTGYRIEYRERVVTYMTDVEYPRGPRECPQAIDLARDADLLIHDGQFLAHERESHRNWGHSTIDEALELARLAGSRRLAIFHHDPSRCDAELDAVAEELKNRHECAFPASEGLLLEV
ncbi:MAG: MBL fold metallo-hydrolase [Armatimonadetes bacterium]|nr:MBL fold metallo-hydrolase [Armatimonadota bacterium]